jgi:hypothetical protein
MRRLIVNRIDLMSLARRLEGLPVLGLDHPQNPLGARYGDVILEVGGVRTKRLRDVLRVRLSSTSSTRVVLFRDGQRTELEVAAGRARDRGRVPLGQLALGDGATIR